ncbi:hypothetical protein Tco_1391284 [Tanacetum coccineum]
MDRVQKPSSENTAQVPPPEDHDSIFIEIPKPKAKKTVSEPNSPEPNSYQPKLPYPKRIKVRENDKPNAQQSRFMKLFKQLRLEIGLKDALVEMPKFNKTVLSDVQVRNWGVMHIKGAFEEDVIPFFKSLRESFKLFEMGLCKEVNEIKSIFKQMKDEADQCSVDKKYLKIEKKQLLINNDRLLEDNISCDISENATSRAQLQAKFSEPQLNQNGTNVNTKFAKPLTFGNKLYYVTPLPKTQFITKVVEKHDLSKAVTSHLHTNKIIAKCTKVLALGLLRIESEPINAYFKKNKVVHHDYLKVTKEHVETLQELLEQARVLTPTDKNLHYAYKNNHGLDCNENIKNVDVSSNSTNVCLSCNECLFSANHDDYVVNYLKDVNKHKKAESVKQKQKTQWKPTGRIFTIVGHRWEPTGRMLGVEGKTCPLPQIPLPL